MDFAHSAKVQDLQRRVTAFMDEHVYPSEARFHGEVEENRRKGNAWVPTLVVEQASECLLRKSQRPFLQFENARNGASRSTKRGRIAEIHGANSGKASAHSANR